MPPENAPEPADPRGRLLMTTIELIEAHGLAKVTVRSIAERAQVNIAAVNYYFRSKAQLIEAALAQTIVHMMDDVDEILEHHHDDPRMALTELLTYLLEGAHRFPRISRAHVHRAFNDGDYAGPFQERFGPLLLRLRDMLVLAVPGISADVAGRRTVALLSSVLHPSLLGGYFAPLHALESAEQRRAYAKELAAQALAPPTSA